MNSPVQFRISPTGDIQINIPVNVDESKLPDVRKTKFPARYRILPTGDFQMAIPKNVDDSKCTDCALASRVSPTIRSDKSSTTHSNKFCSKCHRKQPKECKCLSNK